MTQKTAVLAKSCKKALAGVALATATITLSPAALACGSSDGVYIGTVCATAATYCPRGYYPAEGQLISISQQQALFAVMGTNYGGDGRSTFAMPDMRGRTPVGVGNGAGLSPVQQGQRRGTEMVTLTTQQLPTHSHAATFTPAGGGQGADVQVSTINGDHATPAAGDYIGAGGAGGKDLSKIFIANGSQGATVSLGGVSGGWRWWRHCYGPARW